ncbi:hypothetical protein EIP91_006342 [Steccherinum ochraceum]|uniref:Uncharacterized protein n=1 Tax=Steccherinum ochraceum TaxID=92696 RepID=A0A4R0R5X0_9APHY|nr:hypothetical protein EIP91_006342 [Steccherinum ochraceum]
MDELSEDERNAVLYNGSSKAQGRAQPRFDLDDAFAEDDNDMSFQFSPEAVRQDMAMSMKQDWNLDQDLDNISVRIGYSVDDPDASVSTFDINGSPNGGPVSLSSLQSPPHADRTLSQSRSDSFNEVQLSSEFSSVSLSDHPSLPDSVYTSPEPEPEEEQGIETQHEQPPEEPVSPYPTVQIDVSEDRPVTQVVTVHSTSLDEPSTARSNNSLQEPLTSISARVNSASSPSLPLAGSFASPPPPATPSTAQSNASIHVVRWLEASHVEIYGTKCLGQSHQQNSTKVPPTQRPERGQQAYGGLGDDDEAE